MTMEVFHFTYNKLVKIGTILRVECMTYLERVLNENGGRIALHLEEDKVSVIKDGLPCAIMSVFMKEGEIYVELEDKSELGVDCLNTEELYDVADSVSAILP